MIGAADNRISSEGLQVVKYMMAGTGVTEAQVSRDLRDIATVTRLQYRLKIN